MNIRSDLAAEMTQTNSRVASEHMHKNMGAGGDATAQADANIIIRNAETVQEAMQSGAEIAVRMTEYSAASINAIVKSNVDLVEVTRTMSLDWIRFAQEGIEHLVDFQEEVVHFQEEVVHWSLDAFLGHARRVSDESTRTADKLTGTDSDKLIDGGEPRLAA